MSPWGLGSGVRRVCVCGLDCKYYSYVSWRCGTITDVLLDDSKHISSLGFSGFGSYEMEVTPNSNSLFALVGI